MDFQDFLQINLEKLQSCQSANCWCPKRLEKFFRKHILGISLCLGHCAAPTAARNIPIGQKKERKEVVQQSFGTPVAAVLQYSSSLDKI